MIKQIEVSGAVIVRSQNGKKQVLATQRGYGSYKGFWEIPGGKLEKGETPEQCIVREIREELDAEIKPLRELGVVDYDYPEFHLKMHCILCGLVSSNLKLLEHEAAKWLDKDNLFDVEWLPADKLILKKIEKLLG